MPETIAIVLAAGLGKRMKSRLPKVVHNAAGKPLIQHVCETVRLAGIEEILLVLGNGAEEVLAALGSGFNYVMQEQQLGTGHAVMQAEAAVAGKYRDVLVVCGDTPLLRPETVRELLDRHQRQHAAVTVLSSYFRDPSGYGRIIREAGGEIRGIVEERDATASERQITEGNTGTYCFQADLLFSALHQVRPDNAQGEYYLTDVLTIARERGEIIQAVPLALPEEALGVNSRQQLAEVEMVLRQRVLSQLWEDGVTIVDPTTTYIEAGVRVGRDTVIRPGTLLERGTVVGEACDLGPGTRIAGSRLGSGIKIQNSLILDSEIGDNCDIGPFAYIRPGTCLAADVKVGDFVEVKKSRVGRGSKIPHLAYVGDAVLGEGVNVGAGTITCNYDGTAKYQTEIGDRAFIGSNTNLVAPVSIGAEAVTGAGSTITKDVPPGALAVERSSQKIIPRGRRILRRQSDN